MCISTLETGRPQLCSVTEMAPKSSCGQKLYSMWFSCGEKAIRYCWFARDVTSAQVGGQEQKHFSLLGTKLYFHVNSSRRNSIVLIPNIAALSRGYKPRIGHVDIALGNF